MVLRRAAMLLGALVPLIAVTPTAQATSTGSTEDCAYRVIRDWYSGGRVDGTYPLRCYRAAIRALPEDVLQYSDADRDILRALAFARARQQDDARPPAQGTAERSTAGTSAPPSRPATPAPAAGGTANASPPAVALPPGASAPAEPAGGPERLASGPVPETANGSLPYPVLALAALAGLLLVSGAAGWLAARRR